ncbi:PREDICTED: carbohydrate sulfotransferase 12 [Nanorana parkeri]|uniref:carbohydrate sulfotransferase 12 n=1 Tax=Nanorana parkeri TaxID=125878 RepID=UPI00085507CA|nr:PREDICTED: carbohydrate sulfotransferase 12 [Nanorana parkeri]
MTKSRLFCFVVVLGSVFMILFIIVYWDNVGTANFNLHTSFSKSLPPHSGWGRTTASPTTENEHASDIDRFLDSFLNFATTNNDFQSTKAGNEPLKGPHSLEENVRGYDWSFKSKLEEGAQDQELVQQERNFILHRFCDNSSFNFPTKSREFDDIPNKELDHLIVDDRHGVIYCYVPKVACTNWKRVMIVLSESLLDKKGVPYQDPLLIPREDVHNSSSHLTFNKFWRRYGKFSRHMMKIKLKKYTKFIFVRDPFVRLISAFRSKFELENEDFYRSFAIPILTRFSNRSSVPTSAGEAFSLGTKPSFSQFIQYLLDARTEEQQPFNEHWRQIYRLCHPCQINYDFIGKLETLDEDAPQLLRQLNIDSLFQFPPSYRNRTASSWEEDWFSKIPLEWRQKLYKLYEPDFVLFGYPKPENLLNV